MEGSGKCADALNDATLRVSMPSTAVGIPNCERATDSVGSSSTSEVGVASTSSCEPSSTNVVSSRIERLMKRRSEYTSAVEFEIEASKDHWSQLQNPGSASQEVNETDLAAFQRLKKKWGPFFWDYGDELVVGKQIAEGGQAEIFNAEWIHPDGTMHECVLKVFKEGWAVRDLESQWPKGMLQNRRHGFEYNTASCCLILGGTLLKDGRFAFHMFKYWGDLRKLIDFRMQHNHNRSPPFTNVEVGCIVLGIALGMHELHTHSIIHRDLKASNVLIHNLLGTFDPVDGGIVCDVADFECSVGVVGTEFWRAPEVLQAVRDRDIKPDLFTKKADVYSFGMTCYEVLTGSIPFEDPGRNCFKDVIEGQRPELPEHIDPRMKALLIKCWRRNPLERPSFKDIILCLMRIYPRYHAPRKFRFLKKMSSCLSIFGGRRESNV